MFPLERNGGVHTDLSSDLLVQTLASPSSSFSWALVPQSMHRADDGMDIEFTL